MLIRAATPVDAAAIQAIYAPFVEATPVSLEEVVPSVTEIEQRMLSEPLLPWLVGDDRGRVAGYAYSSSHHQRAGYRWSADCAIYLDPGYRSQGVGRRLYERLIAEVQELGYGSLFAGITLPNPASVRLHERVGFRAVGTYRQVGYKQGAWYDVGWWQLMPRRELASPPPEPRRWAPPANTGDRREA